MHVSIEYSPKGAAVKQAKCGEIFVSRSGSAPLPQLRKFFATTSNLECSSHRSPGLTTPKPWVRSTYSQEPTRISESNTSADAVTDVVSSTTVVYIVAVAAGSRTVNAAP